MQAASEAEGQPWKAGGCVFKSPFQQERGLTRTGLWLHADFGEELREVAGGRKATENTLLSWTLSCMVGTGEVDAERKECGGRTQKGQLALCPVPLG